MQRFTTPSEHPQDASDHELQEGETPRDLVLILGAYLVLINTKTARNRIFYIVMKTPQSAILLDNSEQTEIHQNGIF